MRLCLLFRYQGLTYKGGRWSVYIQLLEYQGSACTYVFLGHYVDEEKAASAYDQARISQVGVQPLAHKLVVLHSCLMDMWA